MNQMIKKIIFIVVLIVSFTLGIYAGEIVMEIIAFIVALIIFFTLLFFGGYIYLLPSITAHKKDHKDTDAILLLNILTGWTLLGWIVAFVWSNTNVIENLSNNKTTSVAEEIEKLAELNKKGILTDQEFSDKKSKLLN